MIICFALFFIRRSSESNKYVQHCGIYTVPKKHPRHFPLQLENQLADFDNFLYDYFAHNLQEYSYQKLSESDHWFSSYRRKCWGCFLGGGHSVLCHCCVLLSICWTDAFIHAFINPFVAVELYCWFGYSQCNLNVLPKVRYKVRKET